MPSVPQKPDVEHRHFWHIENVGNTITRRCHLCSSYQVYGRSSDGKWRIEESHDRTHQTQTA